MTDIITLPLRVAQGQPDSALAKLNLYRVWIDLSPMGKFGSSKHESARRQYSSVMLS